jgi:ATP-dependent RNA helicase RhlB
MQFSELSLSPDIARGISDLEFETCTEVQAATFEHTLTGRDVAVQSQTGTGKTAAFLISIFHLLTSDEKYKGSRALIVAPTRELAVQIESDAKALGKYLPFRTICIYGGVGYGQQEQALADKVELVIGTPGRLLDFNQSGKLDFREMGILVIDEADRLFDMGFYPDIRRIMRNARKREDRLTMLFSATLSTNVRNLAWQFMNDPAEVEIAPQQMTVDKVEQTLFHVAKDEKFRLLLGLLRKYDPRNAVVFCNTKRATEIVAKKLTLNGYNSEFIIGDLPQKKRLRTIDQLRAGEIRILCATDVAARGLHVDNLDIVFNYDIPEDPEAYVHRIGRTARAGQDGRAISLACERFVYGLEPIESLIGMKIPSDSVSEELLAEDQSEGQRLPSTRYDERPPRKGDRRGGSNSGRRGSSSRSGQAERKQSERHRHISDTHPGPGRHAHKHPDVKPGRSGGSAPKRTKHPEPTPSTRSRRAPTEKSPSRDDSMNDRLAYYREKYGEDFVPSGKEKSSESSKKKSASQKSRPENGKPEKAAAESGSKDTNESGKEKRGLIGRLGKLFKRGEDVDK